MVKIKDLPTIERPREKLSKYGPEKLSNVELLAILLRTGTKELNVLKLSKKVLEKFGDGLSSNVSLEELKTIHGLGEVKASEIIACFELGKRLLKDKKTSIILSARNVWERMEDIRNSKKEHFVIFYLDSRSQEIEREIISVGTLNESLVHPREVFESAVKNNAASIIVAHNHPSGDLEPSDDDVEITKKLIHAGKILGIEVISHVIVTKAGQREISIS
jgi:DNA repair protein RadC